MMFFVLQRRRVAIRLPRRTKSSCLDEKKSIILVTMPHIMAIHGYFPIWNRGRRIERWWGMVAAGKASDQGQQPGVVLSEQEKQSRPAPESPFAFVQAHLLPKCALLFRYRVSLAPIASPPAINADEQVRHLFGRVMYPSLPVAPPRRVEGDNDASLLPGKCVQRHRSSEGTTAVVVKLTTPS